MIRYWDSTGYLGKDVLSIRVYENNFWIGDIIFTTPEAHKIRISYYKKTNLLI
jgi:hypothetical protein